MSLKEPIVDGAWYQTRNHLDLPGLVHQVKFEHGREYHSDGSVTYFGQRWMYKLTSRVYLVPTDPAEVVTELRERATRYDSVLEPAIAEVVNEDADLVAKKLGVK